MVTLYEAVIQPSSGLRHAIQTNSTRLRGEGKNRTAHELNLIELTHDGLNSETTATTSVVTWRGVAIVCG